MPTDDDDHDDRIMNDTTMPPPRRQQQQAVIKPIVPASQQQQQRPTTATTSSAINPKTQTNNTTIIKRREKVPKGKGFGLKDWNRLLKSTTDLAQRKGQPLRRAIGWSEIQQHNTVHDGWIVLKGKVYFISPYLAYHPGGVNIIAKQVLGKDCTTLFDKYHRWVNEDGLIGKLLIGYVDRTSSSGRRNPSNNGRRDGDGFAIPAPPRPTLQAPKNNNGTSTTASTPPIASLLPKNSRSDDDDDDNVNLWEETHPKS